ncbi:MAG: FAD-dependent oxidoreductase [Hydrogenophaga sp.]|nr:FAD-dependent oxidoreductase [Hydrogenophaga sp.]
MNIAIIGAGVTGVTLAHALLQDGHRVHVFEQRQTAAEEASYACGGLLSAGWSSPLAAPGMVWDMLYPGSSPTAIRWGQWPRPSDAAWLLRWWMHTGKKAHAAQQGAALALTQLSLRELARTNAELGLEYETTEGLTVLVRSAHDRERLDPYLQWLEASNVPHQVGDAAFGLSKEPALHPQTPLHTVIHLPSDGVGNCRQFTGALKQVVQERGVEFSFGHTVRAIRPTEKGVEMDVQAQKTTSLGPLTFDTVVLCSGVTSLGLLKPLNIQLPLNQLRSHSLSANLRDPMDAPHSGVVDSLHNIGITRLGQRVRITGGQALGSASAAQHNGVLKQLYTALFDWFPGAAHMSSVQTWSGQTPVLPDGLPVLGATAVPGVWLNIGHGLRGWSMASGSARLLADQLVQRDTGIDAQAFSAQRWNKAP